jgi:cell division protease FtsH
MLKNMQASGGKILDFGQSKARLLMGKKTGVGFEDVAGIEEVKDEVKEIVDFLKHPKKYQVAGARIPKGVLLTGAPGTGKTLLARAVAGEASVPFFHASGSEFEEMLVGAGASRVRDLFNKAKKASPCIIFIDEIDAVAKKRGTVLHSGAGEQTLNQILVEMDGLEERANVIILAATNRPDVLDPAILRPGRFDRTVHVPMPDFKGRREILKVHSKGKKFAEDADLEAIAKKTIGYSGADLENLLNEAAIMAALDNRKIIEQQDLAEAYLKVKLGRKKSDQEKDEEDIKTTAYHEAGHAIVSYFTPKSDPVEQVSIISRGRAGGVTVYLPEKDTKHLYKDQILARMRSGVAGRASEQIFLNRISTGAKADIESVTEMAREMVTQYGMSEKLGMVQYGDEEETKHLGYRYGGGRGYSEEYAKLIDDEVKNLINDAYKDALDILKENKESVEKLVEMLLEKEVVSGEEFKKMIESKDSK